MAASRAAADRLEEARTAWAAAYHDRERAVLEELAIVEDSRIEVAMGSRAQLLPERIVQPAVAMGSRALPPPEQFMQPEPPAGRSRSQHRKHRRRRRQLSPAEHLRGGPSRSSHAAHADRPAPDAAQAQGLHAKSSRSVPSPPLWRAPPECRAR